MNGTATLDTINLRQEMLSSWDIFVLRHRVPGNIVVHFLAFIVYYGSFIMTLATWNWKWLLWLPVSGWIGAAGHYIFKDGGVKIKEATFDPQVVFFVTIMFAKIFRGTYQGDVALAVEKYRRLQEPT